VIEHDVRRWVDCLQRGHEQDSVPRQIAWLLAAYPEFRNLFGYRLGRLPAAILRLIYRPVDTLHIHVGELAPGLFIQHGFATIIVAEKIGVDCWINQQVTLGHVYDRGAPVIGDRVTIAAGAVVVGPVRLGDDVTVGANTTVVRDVPAGSVVVSAPTRVFDRANGHPGPTLRAVATGG
jgi:serine O-acetyltransferase